MNNKILTSTLLSIEFGSIASATTADKPNIVYILADDQGYDMNQGSSLKII